MNVIVYVGTRASREVRFSCTCCKAHIWLTFDNDLAYIVIPQIVNFSKLYSLFLVSYAYLFNNASILAGWLSASSVEL